MGPVLRWPNLLAVLLLAGLAAGVLILLTPASPPDCGSLTQLLFVEIDDKHDRCGGNFIIRLGYAGCIFISLALAADWLRKRRERLEGEEKLEG